MIFACYVFWHNFFNMKRTSVLDNWQVWRCCFSLEVASSIPAWSTIMYRFLCISLCQSIKIKPTNMYIASAGVHSRRVQVPVVQCRLGHVIGIDIYLWIVCFWHNFCGMKPVPGMKRTYWSGIWRCCLSLTGGDSDSCWVHDNSSVP